MLINDFIWLAFAIVGFLVASNNQLQYWVGLQLVHTWTGFDSGYVTEKSHYCTRFLCYYCNTLLRRVLAPKLRRE